MERSQSDTLPLSNSVEIPQLGFGVYLSPPEVCVNSCLTALEAGYRHIDTAQYYGNEAEVGKAVQQSNVDRKDVFLTTKILEAAGSVDLSYAKCVESIKKLDPESGYVDLFLIHSPNPGAAKRKEMWQALERLYEEGKAKSIGVSNFGIKHIDGLKEFAKVWPPHVNQIELHPWLQQRDAVSYCEKNNIAVEAYAPLVRNQKANDKTLTSIASKYNVTPSKVLIRYCLQKNWIPLPKSDTPERIRDNADVFGFELDEKDMKALDDLDQGDAGAIVQAKRHNAYATLITRDSYLPGVIILAYTLQRNHSSYPLVVLYTPNLPQNARRVLELEAPKCNMILRECDHLLPPKNIKMTIIAERFVDTWTKLRVFELFEYDAVCYLDADMAVLDNMDVVFECEEQLPDDWLAANHVCVCNLDSDSWAPEDWKAENCAYTPLSHPTALKEPLQPTATSPSPHKLLNGGMFIFHPSQSLWDRMLNVFNTTPQLSEFMFPDQDFLAFFFENKWYALGWQYNAIKTMRYWHPNIWRDEEVICLHYIVDKPWAKRVGLDGVAGYKGLDGVTHCWWWQLYQYWEDERTSDGKGGNEAIALLQKLIAPAYTMENGLGYLNVALPVRA
ncbi:NADP-dependent oxidoreductase domain-containing protein [Fusarium flagelliforme]|uniref:NADP-dependent oxidoreductase domain-containing protein n=1 Tax=Fusarium flagelliforme TaxID=2675880 RepID=UPI001E8E42B8|nr:NADP-dependent oxidoreductase domain-containing protein [Fusarium flagelliforme]KAH7174365.1 NADP-dependent oxidoreductase domain-containing protein [Fusarium flagelliforme]